MTLDVMSDSPHVSQANTLGNLEEESRYLGHFSTRPVSAGTPSTKAA